MCTIGEGVSAQLLKGGLVRLNNGEIYYLKDCKLEPGGRFVLSVGYEEKRQVASTPKRKGVAHLDDISFKLGDYTLNPIEMIMQPAKEETPKPVEPPTSYTLPLAVVSGVLMYALKKISGLDKELKAGTCEMRHQEAVTRIASLEGKVLRKQIVDGAKFVKGQLDERKKDDEEIRED